MGFICIDLFTHKLRHANVSLVVVLLGLNYKLAYLKLCTHTHTHTQTDIYIYIYMG
jgi:hypothetical protein